MQSTTIILIFLSGKNMSKPTVIQVIKSVLSAVIGVRSEENRQKDFEQGSLSTYVIVGIVFIVLFVFGLISLVSVIVGD
jgi:hypothetical protein